MVVAYATVGCVNASVLRTIRSLPSLALQEKIVRSLLISLAIGDVLHQVGTLYWVCDVRRKTIKDWPQALWLSVVVGTALFTLRSVRMTSILWRWLTPLQNLLARGNRQVRRNSRRQVGREELRIHPKLSRGTCKRASDVFRNSLSVGLRTFYLFSR